MSNLTNRGKTYLLILLLSLVFAYLITTLGYFPYLGMSTTLLSFAILSYYFKKPKNMEVNNYFKLTVLFSIFLFLRSEPFITFLNFVATLFFGGLMLTSQTKGSNSFIYHFFSPIVLIIKSIFSKSEFYIEYVKNKKVSNENNFTNIFFGVMVSIILAIVVIPLLSSTNPFFAKFVSDILNYLSLENFFKNIGFETAFVWCLRLVIFFVLLLLIPKILTLISKNPDFSFPLSIKLDGFSFIIPKAFLAVILGLFFFTQYQLYFATAETLSNLELTHSQLAREVFGQLSVVATIVMVLLYNARKNTGIDKILNWILVIQGLFLTAMAYKSAFDYINAWGFTYLRLYGVTVASLITGIFLFYIWHFQYKKTTENFVKNIILFTGILILIVNLVNFDYLIYNHKKATTGQGIDYQYLSSLSADSLSYLDQYNKLKASSELKEKSTTYNLDNPFVIISNIEYLQNKYSKFDLRTFSYLEYKQYKQIKDINTKDLRSHFENYFLPPRVDL